MTSDLTNLIRLMAQTAVQRELCDFGPRSQNQLNNPRKAVQKQQDPSKRTKRVVAEPARAGQSS